MRVGDYVRGMMGKVVNVKFVNGMTEQGKLLSYDLNTGFIVIENEKAPSVIQLKNILKFSLNSLYKKR